MIELQWDTSSFLNCSTLSCRKPAVKETKPEKVALLSKGSGKGSEGRVDIQVTAGQVNFRTGF